MGEREVKRRKKMEVVAAERAEVVKDVASPAGFAEVVLGVKMEAWQVSVLNDFDLRGAVEEIEGGGRMRVCLRACNGAGKTSHIAAPLILWWAMMYPGARVVTTAGVFRQVQAQLWPEIKRLSGVLGEEIEVLDTKFRAKNGSRGLGFRADDGGRFEGFHGKEWQDWVRGELGGEEGPLLIVLDEAKSIEGEIWEAVERCRAQAILVMSSPGLSQTGMFYEISSGKRWKAKRHVVDWRKCPWIKEGWVREQEADWGVDHPLVRSMIWAEFPEDGGETIISAGRLEDNMRNPPDVVPGGTKYGYCDFAAGGDENVFGVRHGNRLFLKKCWRDKDTMAAAGRFVTMFREEGLKAENIVGDNGGMGKVMIDAIHALGWPIRRKDNGSRAAAKGHWKNWGEECWFKASVRVENKDFILPEDAVLTAQLCGRKKTFYGGKLGMESKEEMRARGLRSPDRADVIVQLMRDDMWGIGEVAKNLTADEIQEAFDQLRDRDKEELNVSLGIHAG